MEHRGGEQFRVVHTESSREPSHHRDGVHDVRGATVLAPLSRVGVGRERDRPVDESVPIDRGVGRPAQGPALFHVTVKLVPSDEIADGDAFVAVPALLTIVIEWWAVNDAIVPVCPETVAEFVPATLV